MSNVIGWPANVNQIISDQTSITIGESGYVEDQTSTGHQERYLTQTVSQKKYNVVQFFNFSEKDENGLSEFDRFEQWYEFRHKRGVIPFEFPSISKFNIDSTSDHTFEYARYRITSPLQVSKSGLDMQVSSTWLEVYSGIQNIPSKTTPSVTGLAPENGLFRVITDGTFETVPVLSEGNFVFSYSTDGSTFTRIDAINCTVSTNLLNFTMPKFESDRNLIIKLDYDSHVFYSTLRT